MPPTPNLGSSLLERFKPPKAIELLQRAESWLWAWRDGYSSPAKVELQARLIEAIESGDPTETRGLLALGASPTKHGPDDRTPLMAASRCDSVECARILLVLGADANDPGGKTFFTSPPLCYAAEYGSPELVALLLEHGALLTLAEDKITTSWMPVHIAAHRGNTEILRLLCEHGADIDAATPEDFDTPIHLACAEGHLECVQYLILLGASVHATNSSGASPAAAAIMVHPNESRQRHHAILAELLKAGADPYWTWPKSNYRSAYGQSLALLALFWEAPSCIEVLEAFGARIDYFAPEFAKHNINNPALRAWLKSRQERQRLQEQTPALIDSPHSSSNRL